MKHHNCDLNSSVVCVPSTGIQTVEPTVELRLAIPLPAREKAEVSSIYICLTGHHFDASFTSIYHICVLQGSDSLSYDYGKKRHGAKRFVT